MANSDTKDDEWMDLGEHWDRNIFVNKTTDNGKLHECMRDIKFKLWNTLWIRLVDSLHFGLIEILRSDFIGDDN